MQTFSKRGKLRYLVHACLATSLAIPLAAQAQQDDADIEEVVSDIRLYSGYYVRLAFPERHVNDPEIRRVMQDINILKVDVAYPFLMEVYDDYERHQRLTHEELIEDPTGLYTHLLKLQYQIA